MPWRGSSRRGSRGVGRTYHGGSHSSVEAPYASLCEEGPAGGPHASQVGVHSEAEPQGVERVGHERRRHACAGSGRQPPRDRQRLILVFVEEGLEHVVEAELCCRVGDHANDLMMAAMQQKTDVMGDSSAMLHIRTPAAPLLYDSSSRFPLTCGMFPFQ